MTSSANQPGKDALVLGGRKAPPTSEAVLGGLPGIAQRLQSSTVPVKVAALAEAMNIAALGTAISFAKFIFLPHQKLSFKSARLVSEESTTKKLSTGFWLAMIILLGGLIAANGAYYEAYTLKNIVKPLVTIFLGWLSYFLIFKKLAIKLPRAIEKFDHLIGVMSLMLISLFWIAWTRSPFSI